MFLLKIILIFVCCLCSIFIAKNVGKIIKHGERGKNMTKNVSYVYVVICVYFMAVSVALTALLNLSNA